MLVAIETHPIQYHVPIYRLLAQEYKIPLKVIYGSDFSVAGYYDPEFRTKLAWDVDLLSGYDFYFLTRVSDGGPSSVRALRFDGGVGLLCRLAPKAVLITGYWPFFTKQALFAILRMDCKLLFRGETTDFARKRNPVKAITRDLCLKFLYKRCRKLLYVGHNSYVHYKRLGVDDSKLIFSPYSVDTGSFCTDEVAREELRAITRKTLGIPETAKVVIFSGKLSPRKGPDLLLEAVKQLPASVRETITVIFMGDGEMRHALRTYADQLPIVKTIFLGFKNQSELSPYFHAADFLVLPSRYGETWGLVVNEALHHGLPCVVTSAVGCGPDLVNPGMTGEISETDSAESLASAIQKVFPLLGLKSVREQCRLKVNKYSIKKAAEGVYQAYQSVIANQS